MARRVMVQYRVKPGRGDENHRYIRAVFDELEASAPSGVRYASFVAADGVSFVHVASIETDDGSNPLAALAAFREFTSKIGERCEVPPATTELLLVGAYRAFT